MTNYELLIIEILFVMPSNGKRILSTYTTPHPYTSHNKKDIKCINFTHFFYVLLLHKNDTTENMKTKNIITKVLCHFVAFENRFVSEARKIDREREIWTKLWKWNWLFQSICRRVWSEIESINLKCSKKSPFTFNFAEISACACFSSCQFKLSLLLLFIFFECIRSFVSWNITFTITTHHNSHPQIPPSISCNSMWQ